MIKKYEQYLEFINATLNRFFENQKPYIFCKEGCSGCCQTGSYPFSKPEFDYIMLGYELLPENIKEKIEANIKRIIAEKAKSNQKEFRHVCPFLIDEKCCVYHHRGLICRSYGLLSYSKTKDGEEKNKMPYCIHEGLNYSNVYDPNTEMISSELWAKTGIEVEPVAFNISLDFLWNNRHTKELDLDLSEQKCLIEWFE